MDKNKKNDINVNNSSISRTQKQALSNFLICGDKEELIEVINTIMMMDFIDKLDNDKREELIILLLFLEKL